MKAHREVALRRAEDLDTERLGRQAGAVPRGGRLEPQDELSSVAAQALRELVEARPQVTGLCERVRGQDDGGRVESQLAHVPEIAVEIAARPVGRQSFENARGAQERAAR